MIHFLCPHCADLHASSFQRPPTRWAADLGATHTDECPRTGLPVVYQLSGALPGEPED